MDYLKLLDYHFEITTISEVQTFEMYGFNYPMRDEDMDFFTKLVPKLKIFDVYLFGTFTDKSIQYLTERCENFQILRLWGSVSYGDTALTDESMRLLSKSKKLVKLILHYVKQISNQGLRYISNLDQLHEIQLTVTPKKS